MYLSVYEIAVFFVLLAAAYLAERAAARSAEPARRRRATLLACTLLFGIVAGYSIGTQVAWKVSKRAARDSVPAEEIAGRIESVFLSPWTLTLCALLFSIGRSGTKRDTSSRNPRERR